ncbi:uncharacterized protein LOC143342662 [Colletes latitarsis]|uniref:uncharacterized protein LOC143342662 n=1 Tax=Colletes latitarsis TaxID=2605962 RepID=UPI0040359376
MDDPKLWFAILEKEFAAYGVKSNAVKCTSVLRHLDNSTIRVIADIISAPDCDDSYNRAKEALINRLASSEETQLRQLFSGIELNGRKPSELLREMQLLAGTEAAIAECKANTPASAPSRELNAEIAALTQKLNQLKAVVRSSFKRRPRSRSRSRNAWGRNNSRNRSANRSYRQGQHDLCYFHRRFKERSFKCVQPCNWTGHDARSGTEN